MSMENSLVSGKEHVLGVELCPAKAEGISAVDEQCFCFWFSEQRERWGLALGGAAFPWPCLGSARSAGDSSHCLPVTGRIPGTASYWDLLTGSWDRQVSLQ